MKKKRIDVLLYMILAIILSILFLKFIYNIVTNSILIDKYNKEIYSESRVSSLTFLNFQQSYIAYYNYGNVLYKEGKFEDAIEMYSKALKEKVPTKKECDIRVNQSLAYCNTVQLNTRDKESIQGAIDTYEKAINILTEKRCDEHDEDAKQLKKDIEDEINKLKELLGKDTNEDEEESDEEDKNQEQGQEQETESVEEKIQDIKDEATKDRRETEKAQEGYEKKGNYTFGTRNW